MTGVVWLRRDLRVRDHPALCAAAAEGPIVPLVVLDPVLTQDSPRFESYLHAVRALREDLDGLVVRVGDPRDVVPAVCAEARARAVHVSAEVTPYGRHRDAAVRRALARAGVEWIATGSPYAVTPGRVRTRAGMPFHVFTPFARAWRDSPVPSPPDPPARVRYTRVVSADLPETGTATHPVPVTEAQARARWQEFLTDEIAGYGRDRDRPDHEATSRLSTALKLGSIHPRTLLSDLRSRAATRSDGVERFITELAWREFYADVLWHHPRSAWHDLKDSLHGMQYDHPETNPLAAQHLSAWQAGRTGYPFVDAGMRQLRAEGWMHNRVRMVTASFLTKDLHIWWPHGARHFLDLLRDGDLASNSHGWQWVAGTGTDAAPYFRIFNPVTQGLRFDPDGAYVRRYVPELAHLPGAAAHEPWKHPGPHVAGYPPRIVDHAAERQEALDRYAARGAKP